MSLRALACLLLLTTFVLFTASLTLPSGRASADTTTEPAWEYKVLRLDAGLCSMEDQVAAYLNQAGQNGWELVSYEHLPSSLPKEAEGTLLLRPAATGAGRSNNPPTADSFQGTISMRMTPQMQPGVCRLMFKRPSRSTSRR